MHRVYSGSPPMTRNHTPNKTAQRSQPMIALPNEKELLEDIRSSLDAVGKDENQLSIPDWFQRIASTLATRVSAIGLTCFAEGKPAPCRDGEFLWDFAAFVEDYEVADAAICGASRYDW